MNTPFTIDTLSYVIKAALATTGPVEVHVKTIEGAIEAVDAALAEILGEWEWDWELEEEDGEIQAWAWRMRRLKTGMSSASGSGETRE